MTPADELEELERAGWRALSSTGANARRFYDDVLDRAPIMLLPGGIVLDDRAGMLDSMAGAPWAAYDLQDLRVQLPTAGTGVVTYGVVARRDGSADYSALISSVYVHRDGGWRLVLHQQTPR